MDRRSPADIINEAIRAVHDQKESVNRARRDLKATADFEAQKLIDQLRKAKVMTETQFLKEVSKFLREHQEHIRGEILRSIGVDTVEEAIEAVKGDEDVD
jgi:hypothetical protein